jgi:SAM-dependent methyltransferase
MREFFRIAAPFYDADYRAAGYHADIPLYVGLAVESGGPVLELGCGTGRVLLPTARAGVRIHGVDLSPDMLAELRNSLAAEPPAVQARVSLSEGDIRFTEVGERFGLITAPFRVAQALLERDDQRAWLRNVRRHLAPGGALVFDVFQPNYSFLIGPGGPHLDVDRVDPATGIRTRRTSKTVPHPEFQRLDVEFTWVIEDATGAKLSETSASVVLRWFTRAELENLLELEGFCITGYWGSFQRERFGEGSTDQIIRATA